MNKAELYTFVKSLLEGQEMETTLFDTLLDVAQMNVEGLRPWVYLRASNTSQSASSADSFLTAKTLATDFREWYDEAPIELIDANNNSFPLLEVPIKDQYACRSESGRFCVDYPNGSFYLLGNIGQAYTIRQNYIKLPTLVSSADSASWIFPIRFHKILGLAVAIYWKLGVDYDIISNAQANNQAAQYAAIYDVMSRWDSTLQANMQRGKDPFNSNSIGYGSTSGGKIGM